MDQGAVFHRVECRIDLVGNNVALDEGDGIGIDPDLPLFTGIVRLSEEANESRHVLTRIVIKEERIRRWSTKEVQPVAEPVLIGNYFES